MLKNAAMLKNDMFKIASVIDHPSPRTGNIPFCLFLLFAGSLLIAADAPKNSNETKVVIPFDFVSKFDDGRYGAIIGDMLWKKIQREGDFVLPESMGDVREYCSSHHLKPTPETNLDQMKKIVCEDFGAQIGIWGSIEREADAASDRYEVVIKCVDFSTDPPKVIYDVQAHTESVSELPHQHIKNLIDSLYGRSPSASENMASTLGSSSADSREGYAAMVKEYWQKNPNLVVDGDFESGENGVPKGWEKTAGQLREPLGNLVQWIADPSSSANKVIRFTLDQTTAENEGVMYYSDFFPVEEGAKYRFQCRWRSDAPTVKVFIKCYEEIDSPSKSEAKPKGQGRAANKSSTEHSQPPKTEDRREVYRSQQNLKGDLNAWNTHTEDFTPKHTKYSPRWGRVMLYAYLKPGTVDFDDVVVKQIADAPSPGEQTKIPRHSSETKVTIEEMENNERHSQDLKKK